MKTRVGSYEEARRVIENYPDEEVVAHNLRILKRHIKQSIAVMGALAIVLGIAAGDIFTTICILPSIGVVAFSAYIPYGKYLKTIAEVRDGSYFESGTEAEIIQIANGYIDVYNSTEEMLREERQRPSLVARIRSSI